MACGKIEWVGTREDIVQTIISHGIHMGRTVSPAAMKLIRAMTRANPDRRPTIAKILAVDEVQKARSTGVQKPEFDGATEKRQLLRLPEWGGASLSLPGLSSRRTGRGIPLGSTKSRRFDGSVLTFAESPDQDHDDTCNL
jgi:hypothetical protein